MELSLFLSALLVVFATTHSLTNPAPAFAGTTHDERIFTRELVALGTVGPAGAVARSSTSFGHVGHVLKVSTEVEVLGVHAGRIVALVEHERGGWDGAESESPRHPMRLVADVGAELEIPVASRVSRSGPEPARRPEDRVYGPVRVNLCPKPLGHCQSHLGKVTDIRAGSKSDIGYTRWR